MDDTTPIRLTRAKEGLDHGLCWALLRPNSGTVEKPHGNCDDARRRKPSVAVRRAPCAVPDMENAEPMT
ncbi:MAG: hypothetical protein ACK4MF_09660, partial [Hyphomicrobiaceae bacterium]